MEDNTFYVASATLDEFSERLTEWRTRYPDMGVLALVAEANRNVEIPRLQDVCRALSVPLCGAVFPALIADGEFHASGCLLVRFDVMPFAAIYETLSASVAECQPTLRRLTDDMINHLGGSRDYTLCLIFDSMIPSIASILDELYLVMADRVRYMGANAGSETFRPMPCLFDNKRNVENGVLAMLLPHHPGAVTEHCYKVPENMMSATSTDGNRITTIDWRPAFEVYQEVVKAEYQVSITRENFYQLAVHFPFGILRANNEIIIRIPVALQDDGSVFCVGEVPANALLTLLQAPAVDSSETVTKLVDGLHELGGMSEGGAVLTFYCAGRRIHLGEKAEYEVQALQQAVEQRKLVGALSLGEVGHSLRCGYPAFHNGAVVCSVWGHNEP